VQELRFKCGMILVDSYAGCAHRLIQHIHQQDLPVQTFASHTFYLDRGMSDDVELAMRVLVKFVHIENTAGSYAACYIALQIG
jgi:hypothetical protein